MRRFRRVLLGVGILAMLLILGGCMQIRQEISLLADEQWQAKTVVTVPPSSIEAVGEEALLQSQQDMTDRLEEWKAQGVTGNLEVRQEESGDWVYDLSLEGKGWDLLNETVFGGQATIADAGNGRVTFSYDVGDSSTLVEMEGSLTVILHAGQIHSSNADEVDGGTATWNTPSGVIVAEVSPAATGFSLPFGMPLWVGIVLAVVLLLVLLVVVGLVLFLVLRRKRARAQVIPPPLP